jgi:aldehyde:ferredoxin oxidoreductase
MPRQSWHLQTKSASAKASVSSWPMGYRSIGKNWAARAEFAVSVDGEKVPGRNPKCTPGLATTHVPNPTPARHTRG